MAEGVALGIIVWVGYMFLWSNLPATINLFQTEINWKALLLQKKYFVWLELILLILNIINITGITQSIAGAFASGICSMLINVSYRIYTAMSPQKLN
jgi:hypothetical protein